MVKAGLLFYLCLAAAPVEACRLALVLAIDVSSSVDANEDALQRNGLAAALRAGTIAGAGLDVLSQEPPPADNPLLAAPNCFVTPHLAWATRAARQRLIDELAANLGAFLKGDVRNRVD